MTLVATRRAATDLGARVTGDSTDSGALAKAADVKTTPDLKWIGSAYGLIIVAAFIGWGLWNWFSPSSAPAAGFSVFAPMYILAQSIERFLEPFTNMFGPGAANLDAKDGDGKPQPGRSKPYGRTKPSRSATKPSRNLQMHPARTPT